MDADSPTSLVRHTMDRPAQLARQVHDISEHIVSLRLPVAKSDPSSQEVYFTPRHKLAKEINREMIKKLLEYHGVRDTNCDTVHDDYLAVFCILIRIGKPKDIAHFTRDPESADRHLPFLNNAGWLPQCSSCYEDFEVAQWEFCAQAFHTGRLEDMQLRPNKVIPITARKVIQKGPDSIVEKIEIHPDYNYLNNASTNATSTNTFVLKSYEAKHGALYYNEINAYNRLKQPEIAGNIVRLYGSWKQNQTYSILLEFVNGGTLADLFCSPHPTTSQERLYFWRSMCQIIEPVARIHRHTDPDDPTRVVEGVHQDIKPANILVAKRDADPFFSYTFKLVDMGLAYFSTRDVQGRRYRKKDGRGTQTYSAPECFRNEKDLFDERSPCDAYPSKDIWSLGCVFSLALVWSVLGPAKLKKYQNMLEDATYHISHIKDSAYVGCFHDGKKVLEEVHSMHDQVMRACATSDYIIHGLIPIIVDMLEEAPEERPSAKKLRTKCQQALERATKLLATESNAFPLAFRLQTEVAVQPQTPQELPYPINNHGLGIEGSSQNPFQLPESPVATVSSTRGSPNPPRRSKSLYTGQHSIDTVLTDRSPTLGSHSCEESSIRTGNRPGHCQTPARVTWSAQSPVSPPHPDLAIQSPHTNGQLHNNQESISYNGHRDSYIRSSFAHSKEVAPVPHRGSGACQTQPEVGTGPHATIEEVNRLIKKRKNGVPTDSILEELRRQPSLQKRDQIFLIDNSTSMQGHWPQVCKAFEVLAYLVKDADPDGMELHFTNWSVSGQNKNRTRLLRLLQNVRPQGQGGLESSLSKILDHCIRPGLLLHVLGRARRGVNIYVFTDGIWNREDDTLCGIDDAIMRAAAKMTTRNSIGIQFIQFGDNETGTRRLQMLDDGLRERNIMDIIDHTHVEGNVFKILLGAIETAWDNQPSHADVSHRTSRESANTSNAT